MFRISHTEPVRKKQPPSLTLQFHVDRACRDFRFARQHEYGPLGTPPGGILLRDPSAAKHDNVTIMLYPQCDSHVLSATSLREQNGLRP
jgi:hypothetical protein